MKKNRKSQLRLKKVEISKLNSLTLTGKGVSPGIGKTDYKSILRMCISVVQDDICK